MLMYNFQASDTFVTHSRANFYFLLTSETQDMSAFNSNTRRRTSKRAKKRSENRPSTSSVSTEDMTNDNSLNALRGMNHNREDSDKMESSIDSTKQIKGIINTQIKEGR